MRSLLPSGSEFVSCPQYAQLATDLSRTDRLGPNDLDPLGPHGVMSCGPPARGSRRAGERGQRLLRYPLGGWSGDRQIPADLYRSVSGVAATKRGHVDTVRPLPETTGCGNVGPWIRPRVTRGKRCARKASRDGSRTSSSWISWSRWRSCSSSPSSSLRPVESGLPEVR